MFDIQEMNKYDVVSFDIFDTLIKRLVSKPHDVFKLIEESDRCYKHFCDKRIRAEENARKYTDKEEVTLKDIYSMFDLNCNWDISVLMELEKETEYNLCVPNYPVVRLLNELKEKGKKILLISDMYLDAEVINKILEKCGIANYDKLYVSSKYGRTKSSGSLYKMIKDELNIDFYKWLHIGDNKKSDYVIPKSLGMGCCLYKSKISTLKDRDDKDNNINNLMFWRYVEFYSKRLDNPSKKMGYKVYGPILYGFSEWIRKEVKQRQIRIILFLARDSYLLKKLYDKIFRADNFVSRYLLVSRKSLWLASFKGSVEIDEFYKRIVREFPKRFKIQLLLDELDLDLSACIGVSKEILNYAVDRDSALQDETYLSFFKSIEGYLNERSRNEYQAFLQYVKKLNIDLDDKIAIVDIGWQGTMQMMMENILNRKLYGFYYGINKNRYNLEHAYAYNTEWEKEGESINTFLELFFSAAHGSIKRYEQKTDGTVIFRFKKKEHSAAIDHKLTEIREGASLFAEEYHRDVVRDNIQLSSNITVRNLSYQMKYPSVSDVDIYDKISFYDIEMLSFIKSHKFTEYVKSPKLFIDDYKKSIWKIGFLKKVIGLDISYYRWLTLARFIKGRLNKMLNK